MVACSRLRLDQEWVLKFNKWVRITLDLIWPILNFCLLLFTYWRLYQHCWPPFDLYDHCSALYPRANIVGADSVCSFHRSACSDWKIPIRTKAVWCFSGSLCSWWKHSREIVTLLSKHFCYLVAPWVTYPILLLSFDNNPIHLIFIARQMLIFLVRNLG